MKLGTLRNGTRDGRLVVVSRDITRCSDAQHIAPTLRAALDNWDRVAPHLELIARGVESGGQPTERFHEREAHSPLPRAFQWIEARAAGGAPVPRQGISDGFCDPRAPLPLPAAAPAIAPGAGVAVILGDVPMGAEVAAARAAIRLVLLVNSPRLAGDDAGLAATFSPVAVTPDELGAAWDGGTLAGTLMIDRDGRPLARLETGGAGFDFGPLIAEAAARRALAAGGILGIIAAAGAGAALGRGEVLRIEMRDAAGHSIFGALEQRIESFAPA